MEDLFTACHRRHIDVIGLRETMPVFDTSARTGDGVEAAFAALAELLA